MNLKKELTKLLNAMEEALDANNLELFVSRAEAYGKYPVSEEDIIFELDDDFIRKTSNWELELWQDYHIAAQKQHKGE